MARADRRADSRFHLPRPARPGSARTWPRWRRTADDAGFDFIAVMDHFFQIGAIGPPEREMLEAYTTLGYLAGCTSRAKLLTLVTGAVYRAPGILAKTVTTLDVLSGGRAWLGIGAAWNEEESRGLGIPFPPVAERFERLEETLQICLQMWRGDETPYQRPALPAGAAAQLAAGAVQAAPADHDRRRRRAEDAAAGGQVRAGVQPVPRPRPRPQARRAARPLRRRGPRLRRDHQDLLLHLRRRGEGREGRRDRRPARRAARSWASRRPSARWRTSGTSPRWRSSAAR